MDADALKVIEVANRLTGKWRLSLVNSALIIATALDVILHSVSIGCLVERDIVSEVVIIMLLIRPIDGGKAVEWAPRNSMTGTVASERNLARGFVGSAHTSTTTTRRTEDFCLDATAIRRGTDRRKQGTNGIDERRLAFRIAKVESSLDNIIGVGILDHLVQFPVLHHLFDHHTTHVDPRSTDAFFDYIGAEFLLGQKRDATFEALAKRIGEGRLSNIDDVLQNIVAKGILDQREAIGDDLANDLRLLIACCMIHAAL